MFFKKKTEPTGDPCSHWSVESPVITLPYDLRDEDGHVGHFSKTLKNTTEWCRTCGAFRVVGGEWMFPTRSVSYTSGGVELCIGSCGFCSR